MRSWLLATLGCVACASGAQSSGESPAAPPDPPSPSPSPASREVEREPVDPPAARSDASAPLPPLSTPNARPDAAVESDAAAPAPPNAYANADARTQALARGGTAAQRCHDQHAAAGAGGKLVLRITLAPSGKPARVEADRAASTPALLGGKLEACVIAAFEKETFPAPRAGADVMLQVPLEFRPPAQSR